MPFYEYKCQQCGFADTLLESFSAPRQQTCPQCQKKRAFVRLVSAAGFQLKGQGWYVTDFKNQGGKHKPKDNESDEAVDKADKADKSDEKTATDKKTDNEKTPNKKDKKAGTKENKKTTTASEGDKAK